ncbi:unnamed protein product [Lepeophtheirus salmonis]|uniref:(salmon louse) hypothetical protein n=1 Tax=Lepeophtheirus salmonis TaxID=72036 RepID=A0A7R8H326_LEPSM|nr:unnamed protein product [Lepeophtheirus salmonis]CAF2835389.1 unnamed protein product [Lepeophtheirus salmonis]
MIASFRLEITKSSLSNESWVCDLLWNFLHTSLIFSVEYHITASDVPKSKCYLIPWIDFKLTRGECIALAGWITCSYWQSQTKLLSGNSHCLAPIELQHQYFGQYERTSKYMPCCVRYLNIVSLKASFQDYWAAMTEERIINSRRVFKEKK